MDALIAVLMVAAFYLAFRKIGWWRWFWLGLAVYLAVFELAAKLVTGKTISQQFWTYSLDHPTMSWIASGLIALGGIGLAIHLMWKVIRRKQNGSGS